MPFQIHALPASAFEHLFALSNEQLAAQNAHREIVAECPGTPCRISLEDVPAGEEVIAVNYVHQPANSAYQASHAIFVRNGAQQAIPAANEIPKLLRHRLISVRAFNTKHLMIDADAVMGTELETTIGAFFDNPAVEYIHLHYAKPGCFAASVTRV